jgi:hypothetical protein
MRGQQHPLAFIIALLVVLPTLAANARSKEEFCARMSAHTQSIVDQRDSGKSSYEAVASLVEVLSAEGQAAGGISDSMINTMVATDMVQRVFRTPRPTTAQAMAEIKARCLFGTAETAQRSEQPAQVSEFLTPEAQGHIDRVGFETWIGSLSGDQRRGADFWAAERSKPKPASCSAAAPSPDYTSGCQEAQRRLAPFDVRRKTEPSYRKGWSAPVTEATASEPSSPPPPLKVQSGQLLNRNNQAVSSAVGLSVAQVQSINSGADCSGDMCEFEKGHTPQSYCPSAGPCSEMTLFTDGKQVKGYTADFNTIDWTRSLEASTAALGQPKRSTVGPSGIVRMRNDYWSWSVGDGLTLTYTATSGFDAYGSPLDSHSIMLEPSETK